MNTFHPLIRFQLKQNLSHLGSLARAPAIFLWCAGSHSCQIQSLPAVLWPPRWWTLPQCPAYWIPSFQRARTSSDHDVGGGATMVFVGKHVKSILSEVLKQKPSHFSPQPSAITETSEVLWVVLVLRHTHTHTRTLTRTHSHSHERQREKERERKHQILLNLALLARWEWISFESEASPVYIENSRPVRTKWHLV